MCCFLKEIPIFITNEYLFISEAGKLSRYDRGADWQLTNRSVLIDNVPTGNHQTNAINALPNGSLIWHVGSTCNVCQEQANAEREAHLLPCCKRNGLDTNTEISSEPTA